MISVSYVGLIDTRTKSLYKAFASLLGPPENLADLNEYTYHYQIDIEMMKSQSEVDNQRLPQNVEKRKNPLEIAREERRLF